MRFIQTETTLKINLTNLFGWFLLLFSGALVAGSILSIITADGMSKIAFSILFILILALFIYRLLAFKRYNLELRRDGNSLLTVTNVFGWRSSRQFVITDITKLQFGGSSGYRSIFTEEIMTATFSSGQKITILRTIRPGIGNDRRYLNMFNAVSEFTGLPLEHFTEHKL